MRSIKKSVAASYPVFPLLLKPLLEPVDLFLQYVDPLRELGWRQLLLLIVTGAEGGTPSATGDIMSQCQKSSQSHNDFDAHRLLLPAKSPQKNQVKCCTWQMSERLVAREELQCRPGTADTVRRRRSEATASGRCLPPAAGGSNVPRHGGTGEPPRGPCSPSAAMSTPVLVLIIRHKQTLFLSGTFLLY